MERVFHHCQVSSAYISHFIHCTYIQDTTHCVHASEKSLRFLEHLEMQFNSLHVYVPDLKSDTQ